MKNWCATCVNRGDESHCNKCWIGGGSNPHNIEYDGGKDGREV